MFKTLSGRQQKTRLRGGNIVTYSPPTHPPSWPLSTKLWLYVSLSTLLLLPPPPLLPTWQLLYMFPSTRSPIAHFQCVGGGGEHEPRSLGASGPLRSASCLARPWTSFSPTNRVSTITLALFSPRLLPFVMSLVKLHRNIVMTLFEYLRRCPRPHHLVIPITVFVLEKGWVL